MAYGDEKIIVNVKETDHGEIEYADAKGDTRTLYPSTWSIWFKVDELQEGSSVREPKEGGSGPVVFEYLHGTASIFRDYGIEVLGVPRTKKTQFPVSILSGGSTFKWPPEDPLTEDARFSTSIGSASLGFMFADWEIGTEDGWFMELRVTDDVLSHLRSVLQSGRMSDLTFSLQAMTHLYTSKHPMEPISSKSNLYLRPNRTSNDARHPEMAQGQIFALSTSSTKFTLTKPSAEAPADLDGFEPEAPPPPPPDPVAVELAKTSASIEKLRGTVKWLAGFTAVAALALLSKA